MNVQAGSRCLGYHLLVIVFGIVSYTFGKWICYSIPVVFVFQCIFHKPTHDELPAENYIILRKLPYKTNRKSTKNSTIPVFFCWEAP